MRQILTTKEAAELLRVNPQTLANWRFNQKGPAYIVVGKKAIRYQLEDLETFIREQQKIEPRN